MAVKGPAASFVQEIQNGPFDSLDMEASRSPKVSNCDKIKPDKKEKLRRLTKRAGTIMSLPSVMKSSSHGNSHKHSHVRHRHCTVRKTNSVLQRKKSYNLQTLQGLTKQYLQSGTFEALNSRNLQLKDRGRQPTSGEVKAKKGGCCGHAKKEREAP